MKMQKKIQTTIRTQESDLKNFLLNNNKKRPKVISNKKD